MEVGDRFRSDTDDDVRAAPGQAAERPPYDSDANPVRHPESVRRGTLGEHSAAVARRAHQVTFNPNAPGTPTPIDTNNQLSGVACPSASQCVAIDVSGFAVVGDPGNPGSWTVEPIAGAGTLNGVACSSVAQCVTVDQAGNGFVGSASVRASAPVNVSLPSISGIVGQGQTLSEAHGSWTNSPTSFAYQWQDCDGSGNACSAIARATNQTYTLTGTDVGHTIRVQETASNAGGSSAPASSAATGMVQPLLVPPTKPSSSSPPVISGTAKVGQTLFASTGAWSGTPPISYGYQWQLCAPGCASIAGATASSLTLTAADAGKSVRVLVTASNSAGSAQSASGEVGPVVAAGPTSGQVRAALLKVLGPSGKGARIGQLLKHGSYSCSFTAPSGGRLVISWYSVPKGTHITKAKKPVLVASSSVVFHKTGRANIKIALTAKGRKLLKGAKHLTLTAKGTFAPTGQAATSTTKTFTLKQ